MLDTTRCRDYLEATIAKAKALGLYEPTKPNPTPEIKADQLPAYVRWTREYVDAGGSRVFSACKVLSVIDGSIVNYVVHRDGRWDTDAPQAQELAAFKAEWDPSGWDPTSGGKVGYLKTKLDYLDNYGGKDKCRVNLYQGRASLSFGIDIFGPEDSPGVRKHWMTGGLLFHGDPDASNAITLEHTVGWQVHT